MRTNDKYMDVDWKKELDEYFALGDYPIKAFTRTKDYSYYAFKNRLYKDPRYHGRNSNWHCATERREDNSTVFLPVIITNTKSADIKVNGFTLSLDEYTDDNSLKKLLRVMRDL